jgi:hypothetical protein
MPAKASSTSPADGGLPGLRFQELPTRLEWYPKNVAGAVLVRVLDQSRNGIGAIPCARREEILIPGIVHRAAKIGVMLFEGIGDVVEEDEAKDNMLVLGGVHATAQRIGHAPHFGLVADLPVRVRTQTGGGAAVLDPPRVLLRFAHEPSLAP